MAAFRPWNGPRYLLSRLEILFTIEDSLNICGDSAYAIICRSNSEMENGIVNESEDEVSANANESEEEVSDAESNAEDDAESNVGGDAESNVGTSPETGHFSLRDLF